jgi:hypothetical protein
MRPSASAAAPARGGSAVVNLAESIGVLGASGAGTPGDAKEPRWVNTNNICDDDDDVNAEKDESDSG